jgi:hypothetical protein
MDTLRTPAAFASLVASNLAPIAGILLLGWPPAAVLVSYFIDTFVSMGGVVLLVMLHVTGSERDQPLTGWKEWMQAIAGLALLGAIMAFPMALPIWMTLGDDRAAWAMFDDRTFLAALAVQALMSALASARMHRVLRGRNDDDRLLARRFIFLVARWVVVFVAMVTGFVGLLGPVIGSFVLVAIYAGASIYFETFPERAERLLRGKDAKPIRYEGDLASRQAGSRKEQ